MDYSESITWCGVVWCGEGRKKVCQVFACDLSCPLAGRERERECWGGVGSGGVLVRLERGWGMEGGRHGTKKGKAMIKAKEKEKEKEANILDALCTEG